MKKIRVGVVGVGHLGRYHALNYSNIPEVDLVGVTDIDREKAEKIALESRCDVFESMGSLLEEVEAVSIAVPTDKHFETGQCVLNQGINCLMEKPIAANVEEANELIRIADEKGLVFHVGHVERFNPALRALKELEIKPRFIESHRLAPFNPRGTEVSVILDLMIHDIDIVLSLLKNSVKSVDASGVSVVSDSIDIANARIRFENGCVANLTSSRISQKKMRKMRLFQKDTYITIDFLQKFSEIYHLEEDNTKADLILGAIGIGDRKKRVVYHRPKVPEGEGLQKELEVFIQAVRGERPAAVSGVEGRDALSVAVNILQCMEG